MNRPIALPSMMCFPQWKDTSGMLGTLLDNGIKLLHMDVMDGEFVPNLMLGTDSIKRLRQVTGLNMDMHLMIVRPEDKIGWFEPQPGDYVSIHVESTNHLHRAVARVREFGAHPMVALNPATPIHMIEDVLDDLDGVVIMSVNPGFAGQKLIPHSIGKIARMRRMLDEAGRPDMLIEVDGNVSFENAGRMRAAGADLFVCGTSSIFSTAGSVEENIARIRRAIGE